jgi:hypothetical protein
MHYISRWREQVTLGYHLYWLSVQFRGGLLGDADKICWFLLAFHTVDP